MAAALSVAIVSLGGAYALDRGAPLATRIETTIFVALTVVAWLAAAIGNVARLRFFSPGDIGGSSRGSGSAATAEAAAFLQNTLEQVALAVPVQVALAVVCPRATLMLVVLGASFAIGRGLFWAGYHRGAAARALGFALTFYPSVLALVFVLATATIRLG